MTRTIHDDLPPNLVKLTLPVIACDCDSKNLIDHHESTISSQKLTIKELKAENKKLQIEL
jgi:hypothetical protein